jgi:hypothetical protein
MPAQPAGRSRVALHGGDLWVAVTTIGRGRPVEILHVSERHVYYRNYGKHADRSHKFKMLHDAFRASYAPLRLSRKLRSDGASILVSSSPRPPDPITTAIEQVPVEEPAMATFTIPDTQEIPPLVVGSYEELRPARKTGSGRPSRFTAEQIREVYLLYKQGLKPSEIGPTYGMAPSTVNNIGAGRDYPWATADLRGEGPPIVLKPQSTPPPELRAATPPPAPIIEEEPPMITETMAPPEAAPAPEPTPPAVMPERVTLPLEHLQKRLDMPTALLTDLADALEMMLDLHGKPARRFLLLDLGAMRALVNEAREKAGA